MRCVSMAFVGLLLFLLVAVSAAAPSSTLSSFALDAELVARINAARVEAGQPLVAVVDSALTGIARFHNGEMASCADTFGWGERCITHQTPGGSDFAGRLALAGYGTTVRSGAARRALMSSASGGEGQGNGLQTGDGPSRTDEVRDR